MVELSDDLGELLDANTVGALATIAPDGKPRQSLVYFARDSNRLVISTLTDRHKARDARRTGWASLCVMGHAPPYPSATFSGRAEIITQNIGPLTAAIAQRMTGAQVAPEPMSDETLAQAGRVLLAITIERVSAINYVPTRDK
jgi:PPOX class probable F420-dependent enzyme